MQCSVDGCARQAKYKAGALCQTHYHRMWRNGTMELRQARPRYEDDRGYQFVRAIGHPLLAKGQSYVAEHRVVLYAAIGPAPMECELCSKRLTWATCCVDHIDENPRNNARDNLRPTCMPCNASRNLAPIVDRMPGVVILQYGGERKTATEWARDSRVSVSGGAIRKRKRAGMNDEQALFTPKVTHNGKAKIDHRVRKTISKWERANAVAIEIDGVTRTAAEWSRHPDCTLTVGGVVWRIRAGWNSKDAVFKASRWATL